MSQLGPSEDEQTRLMSHSAIGIETLACAVRTGDEPQKPAAHCRGQAGGHGGHSSVYRDAQRSLVYRDQPQMGIARIPGEGKSWVTTRLLVEVIKKSSGIT